MNVFVVKNISAKKSYKDFCWAPVWPPIFPHTLSQLSCLLPAVLSDKSKKQKFKTFFLYDVQIKVFIYSSVFRHSKIHTAGKAQTAIIID